MVWRGAALTPLLAAIPVPYRDWLCSPVVLLTATIAAYEIGAVIYRRSRSFSLFHPAIVGALLIALLLRVAGIDYHSYADSTQVLRWLLGTATVALAIPLYRHLPLIRELALPIAMTVVLGAAVGALSVVGIAWLMGSDPEILRSLASKSVTTPIAIGISREIGGIIELTNGAVLITAATGVAVGPLVFRLLRISDARVQGIAFGIAAHALGAARAFETNATIGAFATLSLCLTGVISAVAIPLIVHGL
jgi:predicted murein hydrolase (TIGR00659 family)